MPLNLVMDTETGKFQMILPFIVLPEEHMLGILGQETLRQVLSSRARAHLRRTVINQFGVGERYDSEREKSEE